MIPAPQITIRDIAEPDRLWALAEFARHFGGALISSRGVWFDTATLPGFVAESNARPAGVLVHTPFRAGDDCEIIALASVVERVGAATALLERCVTTARAAGCTRTFLTTSNDNIDALRFYQKRGWRIVGIHRDSLTRARIEKPLLPLFGHHGIPIADELELEYAP